MTAPQSDDKYRLPSGPCADAFRDWLDSHADGGATMSSDERQAVWEGFWAGWYAKGATAPLPELQASSGETPRTDEWQKEMGGASESEWGDFARQLERELAAMRLLAAEPHYIHKVKQELGPLSLWDQKGLDAHIAAKVSEAVSAKQQMPDEVRELVHALQSYEQADEDGVYVKVSKLACDEAVRLIEARYTDSARQERKS